METIMSKINDTPKLVDGVVELTDSKLGRVSGGTGKCYGPIACAIVDILISTPTPTPPTLVHEPIHAS
jgi:hypothetical protein